MALNFHHQNAKSYNHYTYVKMYNFIILLY
nr:MAG TPA: hypothetical protein [Caudoviricetes sp.]